jgi:hypothetical protein
MLPTDALVPLALFTLLLLSLSLYGLAASGQFPREHRAPELASAAGAMILFGSIAVALVCLAAGVVAAWRTLPWFAAIIAGGAALLAAPLLLRLLPDRFVNGRGALVVFPAAGVLAALLMWIVRRMG